MQSGFALLHETATRSIQAAFLEMRREEAELEVPRTFRIVLALV